MTSIEPAWHKQWHTDLSAWNWHGLSKICGLETCFFAGLRSQEIKIGKFCHAGHSGKIGCQLDDSGAGCFWCCMVRKLHISRRTWAPWTKGFLLKPWSFLSHGKMCFSLLCTNNTSIVTRMTNRTGHAKRKDNGKSNVGLTLYVRRWPLWTSRHGSLGNSLPRLQTDSWSPLHLQLQQNTNTQCSGWLHWNVNEIMTAVLKDHSYFRSLITFDVLTRDCWTNSNSC